VARQSGRCFGRPFFFCFPFFKKKHRPPPPLPRWGRVGDPLQQRTLFPPSFDETCFPWVVFPPCGVRVSEKSLFCKRFIFFPSFTSKSALCPFSFFWDLIFGVLGGQGDHIPPFSVAFLRRQDHQAPSWGVFLFCPPRLQPPHSFGGIYNVSSPHSDVGKKPAGSLFFFFLIGREFLTGFRTFPFHGGYKGPPLSQGTLYGFLFSLPSPSVKRTVSSLLFFFFFFPFFPRLSCS